MGKTYDVAVLGAGPSGIAAAVYAAKFGAETVLLERDSVIGGTAFKAYVNTLRGQSLSAMDGLISGITKKAWNSLIFDHEELLDRYYDLLKTLPVSLKTDHEVISAEISDGRITSLLCASPSGKAAVSAKIIIDASGSLAIENLTGTGDAGIPAYAYMTGLIGKVETVGGKCYSAEAKSLLSEKTAWARENSKLDHRLFIEVSPTIRADIAQISIRYDNSDEASGRQMRKLLNAAVDFLQEFGYGFENASLICSSKEIFYSAQGSFNANYVLQLSDLTQNRHFSDQIAALPDADNVGHLYYIPYGSLLSKTFDNLLLCGRNIGASANALERIDAIPTHFETGKAAGTAAAIAVKNNMIPSEVSAYEIMSKTEDSVSDKIEILNNATEIYEKESRQSFSEDDLPETQVQSLSLHPTFSQGEKDETESFGELDKILELLGESVLKPDLATYLAEQDEPDTSAEENPETEPEGSDAHMPEEPVKNEMESLLEELGGYSDISDISTEEKVAGDSESTPEPEKEESFPAEQDLLSEQYKNEADEPSAMEAAPFEYTSDEYVAELPLEEGHDNKSSEDTSVTEEYFKPLEADEPSGMEAAPFEYTSDEYVAELPPAEAHNEKGGEDKPVTEEYIKPMEAEPEEPEQSTPQNVSSESDFKEDMQTQNNPYAYFDDAYLYGENNFTPPDHKGVVIFELPSEHRPPVVHKEKHEPPKQPEPDIPEAENIADEPEMNSASSLSDDIFSNKDESPSEADNKIVSSDDVINLLYDDSDISKAVRKTPAYYVPDRKINKDDISFLYEDEAEKVPHKISGRKDKVDSILDMIYEITDPSEGHSDVLKENRSEQNTPGKKTKPVEPDKFKSIKDFLYDTDEE